MPIACFCSDLKSHNVLLDSSGTAKLCDFGLVWYSIKVHGFIVRTL